jgi:hypothetical protein
MNLNQIKTAVRSGKTVHVGNSAYSVHLHVFPDGSEQWNILHSGGSCIGLTHQDGVTLNAPAGDFRVAVPVRPSYAGFPALAIENGFGARLCIMADSVNPGSDAIHVATCNDSRFARLFASAPRLLSALDYLQSAPNDPRNHRRALDAMAEARGEVVKNSGLDAPARVPSSILGSLDTGMDASQAVLVAVVNASGGLVSCDVEWSAHPGSREVPAGWAVHVVPLGLALRASALEDLAKTYLHWRANAPLVTEASLGTMELMAEEALGV